MAGNSYYARFKELFQQAEAVSADLKQLTAEAKQDGVDDIVTLKKLARLSVKDKLVDEREKYRRLKIVCDDVEGPGAFDI